MALTVENVRASQWDKSNLWDVRIDGVDSLSGSVFPINDIEIGYHGIQNGTLSGTSLEFPQTATFPILTMSYMDDEDLSFTTGLREWIDEIVSKDGLVVQPVEQAKKHIMFTKLSSLRTPINTEAIWAYPTGQLTYHGDSDGSVPIYSLQFTVVDSDLHSWE